MQGCRRQTTVMAGDRLAEVAFKGIQNATNTCTRVKGKLRNAEMDSTCKFRKSLYTVEFPDCFKDYASWCFYYLDVRDMFQSNLPTTDGSRSISIALGTCLPEPVSLKKVLKESSPFPMVLSEGIWPSGCRNDVRLQKYLRFLLLTLARDHIHVLH